MASCLDNVVLQGLETGLGCSDDHVQILYVAKYKDIDWSSMKDDPTKFDKANQEIKEFVMVSDSVGGVATPRKFVRFEPYQKDSIAKSTFALPDSVWSHLITLSFMGKSNMVKNIIQKMLKLCGFILVTFSDKCTSRTFGVDYNPDRDTFRPCEMPLRISRVEDDNGKRGSDNSSKDDFDITGKGLFAPLYNTIDEANMPF